MTDEVVTQTIDITQLSEIEIQIPNEPEDCPPPPPQNKFSPPATALHRTFRFYPDTHVEEEGSIERFVKCGLVGENGWSVTQLLRLWETVEEKLVTLQSPELKQKPGILHALEKIDRAQAGIVYTLQIGESGSTNQIYSCMNSAMRDLASIWNTQTSHNFATSPSHQHKHAEQQKKVEKFVPLIWWLDSLIQGLPVMTSWVFRGLNVRIPKNSYPTHETVYWNQFSSASTNPSVALHFTRNGGGTVFVVYSQSSCSVADFSVFPNEQETVFRSCTSFHVVGKLPQTHLRMIAVRSAVYLLVEMSENGSDLLTSLPLFTLLQCFKQVQFLYRPFLSKYIHPEAATSSNFTDIAPMLPRLLGKFLQTSSATNMLNGFDCGLIGNCCGGNGPQVVVFLGEPGSGKTSAGLFLVAALLESRLSITYNNDGNRNTTPRKVIHPLFVSLPTVKHPFAKNSISDHIRNEYRITSQHDWEHVKQNQPLLLVLDSLDEIPTLKQWLSKLFSTEKTEETADLLTANCLNDWKNLCVVITTRIEALEGRTNLNDLKWLFARERNITVHPFWLGSFRSCHVEEYIARDTMLRRRFKDDPKKAYERPDIPDDSQNSVFVHSPNDEDRQEAAHVFQLVKELPGLMSMVSSPILLELVVSCMDDIMKYYSGDDIWERLTKHKLYCIALLRYVQSKSNITPTFASDKEDEKRGTLLLQLSEWMSVNMFLSKTFHCVSDTISRWKYPVSRPPDYSTSTTIISSHTGSETETLSPDYYPIAIRERQKSFIRTENFEIPTEHDFCQNILPRIPFIRIEEMEDSITAQGPFCSTSITVNDVETFTFSFQHKSIQEFFIANAIFKNPFLLQHIEIVRRYVILDFIADVYHMLMHEDDGGETLFSKFLAIPKDVSYRDIWQIFYGRLIQLIESTNPNNTIKDTVPSLPTGDRLMGGRGAMSIISRLRIPLCGYRFSDVVIDGADLTSSVSLRGCRFVNSVFRNSQFQYSDICGAIIERKCSIDSSNSFGVLPRCEGISQSVRCLAISDDKETLTSVSVSANPEKMEIEATVSMWAVSTGRELCTLKGTSTHCEPTVAFYYGSFSCAVVLSPNGKILASAGDDGIVHLWGLSHVDDNYSDQAENDSEASFNDSLSRDTCSVEIQQSCDTFGLHKSQSRDTEGSTKHQSRETDCLQKQPSRGLQELWNTYSSAGFSRYRDEMCGQRASSYSKSIGGVSFDWDTLQSLVSTETAVTFRATKQLLVLRLLAEHTASIRSLAFSVDSLTLITGSLDKTVKTWNIHTGLCTRTFSGQRGVRSVALSVDGQMVASGCTAITLWNMQSGERLKVLKKSKPTTQHHNPLLVKALAFSPDGTMLACGIGGERRNLQRAGEGVIQLWDMSTFECVNTLMENDGCSRYSSVETVVFSPDGKSLASGGDSAIKIWTIQTGSCAQTFSLSGFVFCVTFSPDAKVLASASQELIWDDSKITIQLWPITEQDPSSSRHIEELQYKMSCVAISPDGGLLASGSVVGIVRLWSIVTTTCLKILHEHSGVIQSLQFSPCGRMLASGSDDETLIVWSVRNGKPLQRLTDQGYRKDSAFSHDGSMFVTTTWRRGLQVWTLSDQFSLQFLCFLGVDTLAHARSVAFPVNTNEIVAGGGSEGSIQLFSLKTQKLVRNLRGHSSWVQCLAFSPTVYNLLASGSDDKTIRLWCTTTGLCMRSITNHSDPSSISSIAFSPNGHILAASSFCSDTIVLWAVEQQNQDNENTSVTRTDWFDGSGRFNNAQPVGESICHCLQVLNGHTASIRSVAFSPNARLLASASEDATIKIWPIADMDTLRNQVYSVEGITYYLESYHNTLHLTSLGDNPFSPFTCKNAKISIATCNIHPRNQIVLKQRGAAFGK